jgi:hypothetical protein
MSSRFGRAGANAGVAPSWKKGAQPERRGRPGDADVPAGEAEPGRPGPTGQPSCRQPAKLIVAAHALPDHIEWLKPTWPGNARDSRARAPDLTPGVKPYRFTYRERAPTPMLSERASLVSPRKRERERAAAGACDGVNKMGLKSIQDDAHASHRARRAPLSRLPAGLSHMTGLKCDFAAFAI